MPTPTKAETQARLKKETKERDAKMAKQRADRLAAKATADGKNKDALEQSAKRVAALHESMRKFEAQAEEKAGFELQKAAEKRAALDKALVEARELCKAAGENFKAFQEKFAPQYKRSRLYQVLAIADGRTTVEDVRQGEREKKRRQRARPGQNDVPDKAAEGEEATDKKPRPMEEAVAELRARAKGLGYSLRWRVTKAGGAAFRLIDKNGNPAGYIADSIVGVIELLDEYEGNKTAGEAPTEEPQSEAASSEDAEPTPPTDTPSANGHDASVLDKLNHHIDDLWSFVRRRAAAANCAKHLRSTSV